MTYTMAGRCVLCVGLCLLLMTELTLAVGCEKSGPCSCSSSKGKIDLTPLAKTGEPRFKDISGGAYLYSWNPCTSFSEGQGVGCTDVAVCQHDSFSYFNLGTQDSAQFTGNETIVLLSYSFTSDVTRTTYINLMCDSQEGTLTFDREDQMTTTYYFTLKSKYACLGGSSGLSVGSVITIVFFVVLIVYLAGGIAFQVFVRKSSGKEIVPNSGLWFSLPGLIRDGVFFVVRFGKTSSYDKI